MRQQKMRLYCQNCKQTVSAELLPEFSLLQTDNGVALKQYVHICCTKCDADFSIPKLFAKIAQQLKAQMALGEVAYDFAIREIRDVLLERGYSGEELRKLTAECANETEWTNEFVMSHDLDWIVDFYIQRMGRTQEEEG